MIYKEAANFIEGILQLKEKDKPKLGIVLGSGLSSIGDKIAHKKIPYKEIPNFPISTVEGHKGELVYGKLECGIPVIILSGRFHLYEGYDAEKTVFPIRVLKFLDIDTVILTNMSGAIGDGFYPGHLMAISDHINFTGDNPLIGRNDESLGPRFVDMSESYDRQLIKIAKEGAKKYGVVMHEGVYLGVLGPSYETPSEIKMFKKMGADAVGMSTVFETIAARHMGIKVLGISCFSNFAAGLSDEKISHEEVFLMAKKISDDVKTIIEYTAPLLKGADD